MKQVLHFKIHPNILNIIRQAYWFEEDRQDWAMKCLHSLDGENKMSLDLAFKLLDGDAYFITEDEGITLTAILEEDKEFKKELAEHKEFLKMKKEQEKAKKTVIEEEPIEELSEDKLLERMQREANLNMAKQMFVKKFSAKTENEKRAADELMRKFRDTQYEFTFNSHHYTYKDSARNQSQCPHCDWSAKDSMWDKEKDKDSFIGEYNFGTGIYAYCFECPNCHEKFYYHQTKYNEEK